MLGFLKRGGLRARHPGAEELSAYIDGQLPRDDEARFRRHLEQCPECQAELRTLSRTVALLRRLPAVKVPRAFSIPLSLPAPALPFWLRPRLYDALRGATVAAAALLVITLAGRAWTAPAHQAPSPQPVMKADSAIQAEEGDAAILALPEVPADAGSAAMAPTPAPAPRVGHQGGATARGDKAGTATARTPLVGARGGGEPGSTARRPSAPLRPTLAGWPWPVLSYGVAALFLVFGAAALRLRALRKRWL